jgi:hypothetical protein
LGNKLSWVRSSSRLSGGAAAAYLEEQQPLICWSSSHLSGGAAATYLIQVKIKLTQPQVELEVWAEHGNILLYFSLMTDMKVFEFRKYTIPKPSQA